MPPKKQSTSKKKEFYWSDDEAELLLTVTHQYKMQCVGEGTAWESSKTKYSDILDLFKAELPASEEEAKGIVKDYPHLQEEVTKDILASKLKAIKRKFCEVR